MDEFTKLDRQLLKNCANLIFNRHGHHIPVPGSNEIYLRRDYVIYRLGAVFQQLGFLCQVVDGHAEKYKTINKDSGDGLLFTHSAIKQVSYCFDNLVFNIASLSDYVGNYLGLLIYGPQSQTIKWNGFVKKTKAIYDGHGFEKTVSQCNLDWFNLLHSYRGDIIHRKIHMVEVEGFVNTRVFPVEVDSLHFISNAAVGKYFRIFKGRANMPIKECAEEICIKSLVGIPTILTSAESVDLRKK